MFFFNGRLWISPATMSAVNDNALANTNLSVGNVQAIIGQSTGGQPNTPLRFGSPSQAVAALKSGELCDAVVKAFNPSNETGGPATVVAMRVNPALQAAMAIKDASAATVINLLSLDYGLYTNQIKVKIAAGSVSGLQVTTQLGNNYYSQDNIGRNAFSIQYSGGGASASMTVAAASVVLATPTGTTVATIDLNTYATIQQLVDRINVVPGFAAAVLDGNGQKPSLNGLDGVTAQDVKTSLYTATANLQAVVDYFNSSAEGYVTATRAAGAITVPAVLPFTYLAGGSDGTVTNTEWGNAFSALQTVDVQWVTPLSSNAAIGAMADAHVQYMSSVGRMERRATTGTALATTDAQGIAAAKALNSDRTSLVHLGYYDYDANGNLALFPPYMTAAVIAAGFCGVNPGTPLTNKSFTFRGLERNLRNPTDTDPLIIGGVLCVENTPTGYKCVKSISTWLVNANYNRVEQSVGVALDFTVRNVRNALDVLRGSKNNQITLSRAVSITQSTLKALAVDEPQGPGVLAGNDASPAFKNISASAQGDVLAVEFQCSPVLPVNYIPVTVYAVPFSSTATAS